MPRSSAYSSACRSGAVLLLALLAAGCGSTGGGGGGGNSNLITRDQIVTFPDASAYVIIQRLRSTWLRARTQGSFGNPEPTYAEVFVDNVRYGPIESLNSVSSTDIDSIEYISATDATTLYGTGYAGGIIRIVTLRR